MLTKDELVQYLRVCADLADKPGDGIAHVGLAHLRQTITLLEPAVEPPAPRKVFILQTGEYEQRSIHSLHSTREEATAVDARVRRDWHDKDEKPDIEEYELDADLCSECGYKESLHLEHPDTWTHPFVSSRRAANRPSEPPADPDDAPDATEQFASLVRDAQAWRALQTEPEGDDEPVTYSAEDAIRIAGLWRAGKMIGGDEDGVRDALLAEVERLRALNRSGES
jgi:hypothetical protein